MNANESAAAPDVDDADATAQAAARRFLPVVLFGPLLATTLGIDGSSIFQIFATENLGLSPRAIGTAFGLGVVSIPFQLMAARIPLWRARRNLEIYLMTMIGLAAVVAVLVATNARGDVAYVALGITVLAEIAVSVLYATSWQPLLSFTLTATQRQRLGTRGRLIGGVLGAVVVVVFAAAGSTGRALIIVAIALGGVWAAASLRHVAAPPRRAVNTDSLPDDHGRIPAAMRPIYLCVALAGIGAWPLFLVYVHLVLWPSANLGTIAALQLAGALTASLTWRPTVDRLHARARAGSAAVAVMAVALALLPAPVTHSVSKAVILVAVFVTALATSVMRIALMELSHHIIPEAASVRAFTVLDVIASSSVQLGLLVSGQLVTWSVRSSWPVDPYRVVVVVCVLTSAAVLSRLRPTAR